MRDIKFRAWHKDNDSMVYFDNKKASKDMYIAMNLCALMNGDFGDVLMQYTGLKDKNGVEIYEGDILLHPKQGSRKVIYPMGDRFAGFGLVSICGMKNTLQDSHALYEVIGNIHQNPELLGN